LGAKVALVGESPHSIVSTSPSGSLPIMTNPFWVDGNVEQAATRRADTRRIHFRGFEPDGSTTSD
jgi:hypothetical protein